MNMMLLAYLSIPQLAFDILDYKYPLYLDIDDLPVESFDTVYRKKVKFAWLWKFLLKVRCDYIF